MSTEDLSIISRKTNFNETKSEIIHFTNKKAI